MVFRTTLTTAKVRTYHLDTDTSRVAIGIIGDGPLNDILLTVAMDDEHRQALQEGIPRLSI